MPVDLLYLVLDEDQRSLEFPQGLAACSRLLCRDHMTTLRSPVVRCPPRYFACAANYSEEVVSSLPNAVDTGVYYGWAQVDNGPVYKMVVCIGWNPYYNNEKKSMETHILHKFDGDLYGCILKTCLLGFIREEKNFDSLEELITEIKKDIELASNKLDEPAMTAYKSNSFFSQEDPTLR